MQKWEYHVAELSGAGNYASDGEVINRALSFLNEAGNNGWELVSLSFNSITGNYVAALKRPKP